MNDHPLKGFWIVHHYSGDAPWQSMMDLPEEEALRINAGLAKEFQKTCGTDATTGKEKYYKVRSKVEAHFRAEHLARNGAIDSHNPVYAELVDKKIISGIHNSITTLCFPAEWIDPKFISITLGDSFPNFYHANDPSMPPCIMGKSYGAEQFVSHLKNGKLPTTWPNPTHSHNCAFYIELSIYSRNLPTYEMASQFIVSQRPIPRGQNTAASKPTNDVK